MLGERLSWGFSPPRWFSVKNSGLDSLPMSWKDAQTAAELGHPACRGFGAERDGRLLGFALFRLFAPECELMRIAVAPAERRRRIAARLLGLAWAELADAGCATCFLEVRAGNAPALALYAAQGFERDGLRKNYYDNPVEDALLFHKNLLPKQGDSHEKPA